MKKFWLYFLCAVLVTSPAIAAKVSSYSRTSTLTNDDYIPIINDPGGTPSNVNINWQSLGDLIPSKAVNWTNLNTISSLNNADLFLVNQSGTNKDINWQSLSGLAGGTVAWTDAGTSVYNTTSTDKIGIGTTTPASMLEVQKTGSTAPLMVSSSVSTDGDYLLINSSGNVSINTTTSTNKLHVQGNMTFTQYPAPSAPTLATGGAGSLTGNYKYKTSCYYFGNTNYYTSASAASSTYPASSETIQVTLPSCSGTATGWKIYRTQAGGAVYNFVANTTTSPYNDNTSDASIVANVEEPLQVNKTGGQILVGSTVIANLPQSTNTSLGFGPNSLNNISSGTQDAAFGTGAGTYVTSGSNSVFFGYNAGRGNLTDQNVTGDYLSCFGRSACESVSTVDRMEAFGSGAGSNVKTGDHCTSIGTDNFKDDTCDRVISIGYHGLFGLSSVDGVANAVGTITIGHNNSDSLTSDNYGIYIGDTAAPASGLTNSGCIGKSCTVTTDNSFVLGGLGANLQNFSIGTSSPTARLHVSQTAAANSLLVEDQAADPSPFVINSSGNVGIGTTSPTGNFTIVNGGGTIGWTIKSAANTACTTTCGTSGCLQGWDAVPGSPLACTDATADNCICTGP